MPIILPRLRSTSPQPHQRDAPCGFQHDPSRQLRVAHTALSEDDRDLYDPKAGLDGAKGRFHLEGIAEGAQRLEVDCLQHPSVKDLEAAREVVDADSERRPGVGAPPAAYCPAGRPPF